MSVIKLLGFRGEQPRIIKRLMAEMAAKTAINCRLDDGGLTPLRDPTAIFGFPAMPPEGYDTIFLWDEEWLGWEDTVHAVPGPVATDRLYFTGDGVPKMLVAPDDLSDAYELAVPRPETAATATLDGSGSGDVISRLYVYTWVTAYGEESEPSPASNAVDWQPGYDVVLSDIEAVPTDRNITLMRFYRSQTGTAGDGLYFIAERAAANTDFTDDIAIDDFGELLPSTDYNTPVDTLTGLTAMWNGMMAGFSGKTLYFCEPYLPHAWPEKYALTVDYEIVALGVAGQSLIVMTKGLPYVASGTAPESMRLDRIESNLPCINTRGVVDLGYAIAYPTHEGLAVAKADGAIGIITGAIFNPDDWRALAPASMVAGQVSGRYVASYRTLDNDGNPVVGTLIIEVAGDTAFLIRSDIEADAFFYDLETGFLYFRDHGTATVRQFDPPDGPRAIMQWRSKEFILPGEDNFGVIRIDAKLEMTAAEADALADEIEAIILANATLMNEGPIGGDIGGEMIGGVAVAGDLLDLIPTATATTIAVNVYANGRLRASVSRINRTARLPAGFKARKWEIEVVGDVTVEQISMAATVEELMRAA